MGTSGESYGRGWIWSREACRGGQGNGLALCYQTVPASVRRVSGEAGLGGQACSPQDAPRNLGRAAENSQARERREYSTPRAHVVRESNECPPSTKPKGQLPSSAGGSAPLHPSANQTHPPSERSSRELDGAVSARNAVLGPEQSTSAGDGADLQGVLSLHGEGCSHRLMTTDAA